MDLKLLFFIFLYDAVSVKVELAKILAVYPTPSISHQIVFRKLTLELVKQGHEVTVITPDPAYPKNRAPENLSEIDLQKISYETLRGFMGKLSNTDIERKLSDSNFFATIFNKICEVQLQESQVQDILFRNKKEFDLILIEELARPFLGISHIFDAPIILFSSFGGLKDTHEIFGLQTHPILYPSSIDRRIYNLTVWEKVNKIYTYFHKRYLKYLNEDNEHKVLQKYFGKEVPTLSELYQNVHMLFLNTHPIWVENQPAPLNVVYLGGFHQLEESELPQDLKNYLDSSKLGVIYVSFGTNALSTLLPTDKVEILAKVLGQLPYDVLWKWDKDELPGLTRNIKLSKWLPQADLLRHPKIKLFITQAGLQSTDEAITAGVPLIAFPILGDQWYNAEKCVKHGIGKKILFEEVTEDLVKNAVNTVIEDESYRKNIIKLREIIQDQPQQPLERAMFWISHVIRNKGGKHLRASSANLTWTQYYEMEILLILCVVICVLLILFSFVIHYIYKCMKNKILRNKLKQS